MFGEFQVYCSELQSTLAMSDHNGIFQSLSLVLGAELGQQEALYSLFSATPERKGVVSL